MELLVLGGLVFVVIKIRRHIHQQVIREHNERHNRSFMSEEDKTRLVRDIIRNAKIGASESRISVRPVSGGETAGFSSVATGKIKRGQPYRLGGHRKPGELKPAPLVSSPSYRKKNSILTKTELRFFLALRAHLGDQYEIFAQPVLYSMLQPTASGRRGYADFSRIKSKSVDFVLCDPNTLEPRVVVELDDWTHQQPRRIQRDAFVRSVFEGAGVKFVSVKPQNYYPAYVFDGISG
jgi:hypothetical protein